MAQTPKKKGPHLPSKEAFLDPQLDLFQKFLCNTDEERDQLSNTIELWDSMPKYAISAKAMTKMRTAEGHLPRQELSFRHKGREYTVRITPCLVEDENGQEKAYYPGATEELVEDALRKIAVEQYSGFFDRPNFRSGVVFSLYMLRNELQKRGHTRSYQEIKRSLDILSSSIIEIRMPEDQGFIRSTYLPTVAAVSRTRLAEDPNAKWIVHFHSLVTQGIDTLTYRQFNYHKMMALKTQLSRWLFKQLVHKFTFASLLNSFDILYSTVKRDSGLLSNYRQEKEGVRALANAFEELREMGVLFEVTREDSLGRRGKIEDVKFHLKPSAEFIKEMKAANKRLSDSVVPVDKSGLRLTGR